MDINAQKEQFSKAYVQAISAVAGCSWATPSVDDDSIDVSLSAKMFRGPKLDLQLKCHAAATPTGTSFAYQLKLKNFDELRGDQLLVPRILVVLLVPPDPSDWLKYSEPELTLRRAAYWVSLRGLPATTNKSKVTIQVPQLQHFDVVGLQGMMNRISTGGLP